MATIEDILVKPKSKKKPYQPTKRRAWDFVTDADNSDEEKAEIKEEQEREQIKGKKEQKGEQKKDKIRNKEGQKGDKRRTKLGTKRDKKGNKRRTEERTKIGTKILPPRTNRSLRMKKILLLN